MADLSSSNETAAQPVPDFETVLTVQEFARQMVRRIDARHGHVCQLCDGVDSHRDGCPFPSIEAWLQRVKEA